MEEVKRNEKCEVYGTELCKYLGCDGCEVCLVDKLNAKDKDSKRDIATAWEVTLEYIPENIDQLHLSEDCQFCRGEAKNKKDLYAVFDAGHPEPEFKKGMFFGYGKKVRSPIGSLISVPIGCCKKCAHRHRIKDFLKWIVTVVALAIGIILMATPAVNNGLAEISWVLPIVVFVAVVVAGYGLGELLTSLYMKKTEPLTIYNAYELPIISRMKWLGWEGIQTERSGAPRLNFSKKKIRKNLKFKTEDCIIATRSEKYERDQL